MQIKVFDTVFPLLGWHIVSRSMMYDIVNSFEIDPNTAGLVADMIK